MLEGLAAARWPGRLELIHQKPDIILDGAHNPSGVTVLRKALDDYYPDAHRIFVFGMMADKDVSLVSQILFRDTDTIYTVLAHTGDRAETRKSWPNGFTKMPFPCRTWLLPTTGRSAKRVRRLWFVSAALCTW